jgi:cysteine desulfurase
MIYFDNNATTRPLPQVRAAMANALETCWGNPSSANALGQAAARAVEKARGAVADLVGISADRLLFTSGATEANEAVLRHHLAAGHALVTSEAEHPALSGVYRQAEPNLLRMVGLDADGRWKLFELSKLLGEGPALVAVSLANGETGVLQNIDAICVQAREAGSHVLVDASQALGRLEELPGVKCADYLSVSAHKLHGPKGVGALALLSDAAQSVISQVGGGQERGRRGGTENVPGIVGFGEACAHRTADLAGCIARLAHLRDRFEAQICSRVRDAVINGAGATRAPNTSSVTFNGVDGMALVGRLEDQGVVCSQVSACSSGSPGPSETLLAMGLSARSAFSTLRFGFAVDNSEPEIDKAVEVIEKEMNFLKSVMGDMC